MDILGINNLLDVTGVDYYISTKYIWHSTATLNIQKGQTSSTPLGATEGWERGSLGRAQIKLSNLMGFAERKITHKIFSDQGKTEMEGNLVRIAERQAFATQERAQTAPHAALVVVGLNFFLKFFFKINIFYQCIIAIRIV